VQAASAACKCSPGRESKRFAFILKCIFVLKLHGSTEPNLAWSHPVPRFHVCFTSLRGSGGSNHKLPYNGIPDAHCIRAAYNSAWVQFERDMPFSSRPPSPNLSALLHRYGFIQPMRWSTCSGANNAQLPNYCSLQISPTKEDNLSAKRSAALSRGPSRHASQTWGLMPWSAAAFVGCTP